VDDDDSEGEYDFDVSLTILHQDDINNMSLEVSTPVPGGIDLEKDDVIFYETG